MATIQTNLNDKTNWGRTIIYSLIDSRTNYFFYVGVSARPLTVLEEHVVLALKRSESPLNEYIRNMLLCGCKPGLIELEDVSDGERIPQRKNVWVEELKKRGKLLSSER